MPRVADGVVLVARWQKVLFVLRQVELADLLLHVLVEGCLPEALRAPHRVLLYTRVRELDDARAQLLQTTNSHDIILSFSKNKFSCANYQTHASVNKQ